MRVYVSRLGTDPEPTEPKEGRLEQAVLRGRCGQAVLLSEPGAAAPGVLRGARAHLPRAAGHAAGRDPCQESGHPEAAARALWRRGRDELEREPGDAGARERARTRARDAPAAVGAERVRQSARVPGARVPVDPVPLAHQLRALRQAALAPDLSAARTRMQTLPPESAPRARAGARRRRARRRHAYSARRRGRALGLRQPALDRLVQSGLGGCQESAHDALVAARAEILDRTADQAHSETCRIQCRCFFSMCAFSCALELLQLYFYYLLSTYTLYVRVYTRLLLHAYT